MELSLEYVSVYKKDLEDAASKGAISPNAVNELWDDLKQSAADRRVAFIQNIGYFGGALLIVMAMIWFADLAWKDSRSLALFMVGAAYVGAFGLTGNYFWRRDSVPLKTVGGLFVTIAVSVSSVAAYGLIRYFGVDRGTYSDIGEEATVVVIGAIALYFVNYPLITLPMSVALYIFCHQDIAILIFGKYPTRDQAQTVATVFGLVELVVGYLIQRQKFKTDYTFWIYLFGAMAYQGSFTYMYTSDFETNQIIGGVYLLGSLILVGLSIPLKQMIFTIAGGSGIICWVGVQLYNYGNPQYDSYFAILMGLFIAGSGYYEQLHSKTSVYPYWAFLFGVLEFQLGSMNLVFYVYNSVVPKIVFVFVSIAVGLAYIPTKRNVCLFSGVTGVLSIISWAVNTYIQQWAVPILLTLLGLGLIALAVWLSTRKIMEYREKKNNTATYTL